MAIRKSKAEKAIAHAPYTSKIIKATALIADTKTLLSHWDTTVPAGENVQRLRHENVFAKASRSRVEDILVIFRQRFLADGSVANALVTLVKERFPAASLERILYFHSAKADGLLFDFVTEYLVPQRSRGVLDVEISDVPRVLRKWIAEGKTTRDWSEVTTIRVAQHLLATLRDFGILHGTATKKIAPPFLPAESFAYIAFYLKQRQPSGAKLIELPDWKLFFLTRDGVERLLLEAHQQKLLDYHVAGSVTRLTFPASTLEEYANVLAQSQR